MIEKLGKNLIAIAIIIVGVLIAGAIVFVSQRKITSPEALSSRQVGEKVIKYINENILKGQAAASLGEIVEESGLYKLTIKIEDQEFPSYVTRDGRLLFPEEAVNLDEELPVVEEPSGTTEPSIDIPEEELAEFIGCLEGADFVIYGANWCGWTQQLVTMLGGWETVKPIYVECTEKSELCREKGITGYPTILINDKQYQGNRAFEGFSEATGCQISEGTEILNPDSPAGGCY